MSTHSVTTIIQDNKPLVSFYTHSDGYPEGYGLNLYKFLKGFKIVNGIGTVKGKMANGIDCLAAQLIAKFKTGIGGVYIIPANIDHDEEFSYDISLVNDELYIKAYSTTQEIFSGNIKEFGKFCLNTGLE